MLIGVVVGVLVALLAVEAWLVLLLRRAGVWARPMQVSSLSTLGAGRPEPSQALRARVLQVFEPTSGHDLAHCLAALGWLVEQFPPMQAVAGGGGGADGATVRIDPQIFPHARRPHCGEIAALYREVLAVLGVESRLVWLRKNIFDPHDSHISVEARLAGRWVLIDPTFHATFADAQGEPIDAQQVKAYLYQGQRDAVVPTVHGRPLCPLALHDYYFDVLACFNNVFILDTPPGPAISKLPPLRYAMGPRLVYGKLDDESVTHLRVWRQLYAAATWVLPVSMLVAVAVLLVAVLS